MNVSFYTPEAPLIPLKGCTGLNKKNILLMSNRSEIPAQLTFLQKVLRAVDIDLEEDVHFLIADDEISASTLSDKRILEYDKLITFGFKASQLGIRGKDSPTTRIFYFEAMTYLIAPALSVVSDEPAQKKQLWNALKEIYKS
jgi:hypothetical protein